MSLGQRIRQRRDMLGMSQQQLADLTRMKQNIISRLEHDLTPNPGVDVLKRLARALRCSIDWLVELYDEPPDASWLLPALSSA